MTMTCAERAHTKRRLAERYGIEATSADIFGMAKRIAHGEGRCLGRQSRDVARWQLDHAGQSLRLVYDRRRRCILTALPALDSDEYLARRPGRPVDGGEAGAP